MLPALPDLVFQQVIDEFVDLDTFFPGLALQDATHIVVEVYRPSLGQPSKSAILGLVAAALGIRRDEEAQHQALSTSYGFAVRVDAPGELLRDYHTTLVPPQRRGSYFATRREELAADTLHTILSQRDYRMDAGYTIALWVQQEQPPHSLERLAAAIKQPCFPLYLGRKSCPLALPLRPLLIQADKLKEAFDRLPIWDPLLANLPRAKQTAFFWEHHDEKSAGFPDGGVQMVYARHDRLLSRRRWQFAEREESYLSLTTEEE